METEKLINELYNKNNSIACDAMKELAEISKESDEVYPFMDSFIEILSSDNSYVRNRALCLISANARWDKNCVIDEIIDEYLKHITDIKPITARQCISYLPEIASRKPDLKEDILKALRRADVLHYSESMRGLVFRDIQKAIRMIENEQV